MIGRIYQREEKFKNYQKIYQSRPQIRLYIAMGRSICRALKGHKKGQHWEDIVGYNMEDLKLHLEKQFTRGMTWQNYGVYWHVDHRIPQSWFKYEKPEDPDFKKCWALDNLQPKKSSENYSKNNRYAEPTLNNFNQIN